MSPHDANRPGALSSALKALSIIEGIVDDGQPVAIGELASRLGLPKPTAHRIAVSLEQEGFLQREPGSRRFVCGSRLIDLATATLEASALLGPRRAILRELSTELGETCNLGVLAGNEIIYLDRVEAEWPLNLNFRPGSRVPLHCTAIGKLFLSHLPRKQRDKLIATSPLAARTTNTITDAETLVRQLDEIRRQGFAIDDEEFIAGVVCAAVPVRGRNRRCCAGIAVSAPAARLDAEKARSRVPDLRRAAERLSRALMSEGEDV
jgi:DNA-binding IclR family transcriptional regulator